MNAADTSWVLVSAALVMFMTPGLALFYGGMIRARSVLNTMALTAACLSVVSVIWVAFGFSLAFGPDHAGGFIGDFGQSGLHGLATALTGPPGHRIPVFGLASFQLMFAIITVALLAGAVVGKRLGWPRDQVRPHNLPMVMLGAGILWFGWFGFNAGSALAADGLAATAFINTMLAGGTGMLGWLIVEQRRDGKPTTLGAASGMVAGLVGITPACGFVEPLAGAAVGLLAGVACALAVTLKYRFGYDDSLDVVAVHGVGGVAGLLLTGLLATGAVNPAGGRGLFYGGGATLLGHQALAVLVTIAYSATATLAVAWAVQRTVGLRAAEDDGRLGTHLSALHSPVPHRESPRLPPAG